MPRFESRRRHLLRWAAPCVLASVAFTSGCGGDDPDEDPTGAEAPHYPLTDEIYTTLQQL